MIKQTWDVSKEDRVKILQLHENATKNHYLMGEQTNTPTIGYQEDKQKVLATDENYAYILVQPMKSMENGFNPLKSYYVFAVSNDLSAYVCDVIKENTNGFPIEVKVDTNRKLPDVNKGEFIFNLIKYRKDFDYNENNELTKNSFLGTEKSDDGIPINDRKYGVIIGGQVYVVSISKEGPSSTWNYSNDNVIYYDSIEVGSVNPFNPFNDVFYSKKYGYFSLVVPTRYVGYPIPIGKQPEQPTNTEIVTPEPPPPIPLGGQFGNNISTPSESVVTDPSFLKFKEFVEKNDISKFVFDIQSSASKCNAGYKENDSAQGKWKDDKTTYPDVTISTKANQDDLGNLNLTKARAQNLKNFLIKQMPKLKDAKFRLVAQGSLGVCGTEEQNKEYRRVDLTVTKV